VNTSAGARKMVLVGPSFNLGATAPSPPLSWGQILFRGGQAPCPPTGAGAGEYYRFLWWTDARGSAYIIKQLFDSYYSFAACSHSKWRHKLCHAYEI